MATNAVTPAPDADLAVVATKRQYPDLSEKVRSDLLILNRDLQLEARLIDDLLDLTRISTGKIFASARNHRCPQPDAICDPALPEGR